MKEREVRGQEEGGRWSKGKGRGKESGMGEVRENQRRKEAKVDSLICLRS